MKAALLPFLPPAVQRLRFSSFHFVYVAVVRFWRAFVDVVKENGSPQVGGARRIIYYCPPPLPPLSSSWVL